jgi:hypothetical protein
VQARCRGHKLKVLGDVVYVCQCGKREWFDEVIVDEEQEQYTQDEVWDLLLDAQAAHIKEVRRRRVSRK